MYEPRRQATSRTLLIRRVSYHLREWGNPDAPCLVLVHGSRDFGASFQFVVDALEGDWHILAPDWRGHGRSGWTPGSYWQAEFVADLHAVLDDMVPGRPIVLVGHSMGANVASLYAATAPDRVHHLVMLDAMGELLDRAVVEVHGLLQRAMRREVAIPRTYRTMADLQARLMRHNSRLEYGRAAYLASEWLVPTEHGLVRGGDPSFRRVMPSLHQTEEWLSLWPRISAPVLYVSSTDRRANSPMNEPAELHRRMAAFGNIRRVVAPDTGHNVHHDATSLVANLIERHTRGEIPADLIVR